MATKNIDMINGEFWQITPKPELSIHHAGLISFLGRNGFYYLKYLKTKILVKVDGNIVNEVDMQDVIAFIYGYINNQLPESLGYGITRNDLRNLFARGIEKYINGTKLKLLPIRNMVFCRDTKEKGYFFFKNTAVEISATAISTLASAQLPGLVWKEQLIGHDFNLLNETHPAGEFETFAQRICDNDIQKFESLKSILGYLLHGYWSPSTTIIPCFLDLNSVDTETANGGTGKTLLCLALKEIKKLVSIDGKRFNPSSAFPFQRVNIDTQLILIDDLDKNTPFEPFFSLLSLGIEVNKKNKAEVKFDAEDNPKIFITSNFPIKSIAGNSTERRKIEFEIGDHYGPNNTPRDEFGHDFFRDWNEAEFNLLFNFFARCLQLYLKQGIIKPMNVNAELRAMQGQVTKDLVDFLLEKIDEGKRKFNKQGLYDEFLQANPGQRTYHKSRNVFIRKVRTFLNFYYKDQWSETPANTKKFIELDLPEAITDDEISYDGGSGSMSFEDAIKMAAADETQNTSENYSSYDVTE